MTRLSTLNLSLKKSSKTIISGYWIFYYVVMFAIFFPGEELNGCKILGVNAKYKQKKAVSVLVRFAFEENKADKYFDTNGFLIITLKNVWFQIP